MSLVEESVWKGWDKTGKTEFMKRVRSRLPAATTAASSRGASSSTPWWRGQQGEEVRRMTYDLVWKALKKVIKADAAVQTIGEMIISHPEVANTVVDVFALVDTETGLSSASSSTSEDRKLFRVLLEDCEKFLPEGTLKERMEIDTLGEVGVLKAPKKFFNTVIKLKTKLFYKQQKFNLFREETEGYAKLITELNQDFDNDDDKSAATQVYGVVKSIIGYFNLDPNRVLDIVLDSFERRPAAHAFFAELIRLYTPDGDTLAELLGFKFKFYETESEVPASLYRMTALLVHHEVLDLERTWAMMAPADENAIRLEAEKEFGEAKEFVRKMNIVSTTGNENEKENNSSSSKDSNKKSKDLESTNTDLDGGFKLGDPGYPASNQKFGLLQGLLEVGAWKEAELLLSRLPAYYAASKPAVAAALHRLIHQTIDPLHVKCCGSAPVYRRVRRHSSSSLGDTLSPVEDYDGFSEFAVPMLLAVGPYAYNDAVLLYKVIRIIKSALGIPTDRAPSSSQTFSASPDSPLYYDALTLCDEVLLPALSLTECNCCLAEEVWAVLSAYPYHARYRLYGQWKADAYATHPRLMRKKARMQKQVKRIMQRVSKDNVKPTSRQLGKLTHSSPGLLFDYILSQIQLYDNLIGPVVDSLKYCTNLSFDVLGYSIIEALNNPEKDRTKHDGTSISLWLQSLSNFCGAVFKKYPIELTGILQYVANQLKSKKSLDLLILKEIVLKMSGIEAAEEMTDEQIDAMSGGELLRQEAGSFSQIKNTRKSSQRLKDALIDSDLAVPLCLLTAQQRNCVVYRETAEDDSYAHLKLVGKLFDQCQDTLVQFGTFLASNLSVDDYTRRLPPIEELLVNYHVNLDLAFFIARPMFNHQISLKVDELRRKQQKDDSEAGCDHRRFVEASREVMLPVTDAIRPLHSPKIWDDVSPTFVTTFWSLTMYDLATPEEIYGKELAKLKAMPAKIDENKEYNSTRKKREKERVAALAEKLADEMKKQKEHVERVMARLKEEKDGWFFSRQARMAKNETITNFLQLCLFPRCVFTASDAVYAAKFVQVIHALKTPNFSTLICFDRIFCDITYTVTSCTENEAHRYGRFLSAMLKVVMRWHAKKETFDRECVAYPGFVTKFRVAKAGGAAAASEAAAADANNHVDYENFRHVCHKWHYKIAKALVVCLESKDYVQIRNALTVLFKILPFFPVIINLAGVIEKRIEKVCAEEKDQRKDLYVMATSYMGQLKSRKPGMMKEHEFHLAKKGSAAAAAASSSNGEGDGAKKRASAADPKEDSSSRSKRSKDRETTSSSRGASREKSESKSTSSSSRKERDGHSRGRDSNSRERSSRSRERSSMGPPTKTTTPTSSSSSARRGAAEQSPDERDSKRRKVDQARSSRERSNEPSDSKKRKETSPTQNGSGSKSARVASRSRSGEKRK